MAITKETWAWIQGKKSHLKQVEHDERRHKSTHCICYSCVSWKITEDDKNQTKQESYWSGFAYSKGTILQASVPGHIIKLVYKNNFIKKQDQESLEESGSKDRKAARKMLSEFKYYFSNDPGNTAMSLQTEVQGRVLDLFF